MAYGLQVRDGNGVLTFDSQTAVGGVCLGLVTPDLGTPIILYLTTYPGRTVRVLRYDRFITSSIDYGPGYPVVTLTRSANDPTSNGYAAVFVY